jgi:hypothetical protein
MTFPRRLSPKAREALWHAQAAMAREAGRGEYPICNLCGGFVLPGRLWDVSHDPSRPRAWGGEDVGVAHRKCNRQHGARVVTPAVAKAKRQWRNNVGINEPGLGPNPLPGGRLDRLKKKMSGEVVRR